MYGIRFLLFNSVTRLLKASNSNKPRPTSVGSPTASMTSIAGVGPKLVAAQTELQACEQTLAAREAELDALRIRVVRDGLQARCKALVECAWTWGEMGKEGLRALEDSGPNGHGKLTTWAFKSIVLMIQKSYHPNMNFPMSSSSHFRRVIWHRTAQARIFQ